MIPNQSQGAIQRRSECKPILIGFLTGIVSPFVGVIFGIRHRSWIEAVTPLCIAGIMYALVVDGFEDDAHRRVLKYGFQLVAGLATGIVAYTLKQEAMNRT
jgi:ABC-type thiamin/hydroxymethylpyrimidine transport system permease subunit